MSPLRSKPTSLTPSKILELEFQMIAWNPCLIPLKECYPKLEPSRGQDLDWPSLIKYLVTSFSFLDYHLYFDQLLLASFAELMGGSLSVETEEGVGSSFSLSLPIKIIYPPTEKEKRKRILGEKKSNSNSPACKGLCIKPRKLFGKQIEKYLLKHNLHLTYVDEIQDIFEVPISIISPLNTGTK